MAAAPAKVGGADEVRSAACRRDAGEQLGICGELCDVLERQSRCARTIIRDDKGGDLYNLTLTSRCRTGLLLSPGDVALCVGGVAAVGSHHGEQGVLDCAHRDVHRRDVAARPERLA